MKAGRHEKGVTLIELLVVLAILAMVSGAIALNLPPARGDAKKEAERFAARLRAATNEALVTGIPIRLDVSPAGYEFAEYKKGEWRAVQKYSLRPEWQLKGVSVMAEFQDASLLNEVDRQEEQDEARRLLLDPIGALTPLRIEFSDRRERWFVIRTVEGIIQVESRVR